MENEIQIIVDQMKRFKKKIFYCEDIPLYLSNLRGHL